MSLKNIISEMAPITYKIKAKNRNFPFNRISGLSDFIDVRENKSAVIIARINAENTYSCIGNLYHNMFYWVL